MTNEKLKNLIKLSCNIKLYIPSEFDAEVQETATLFSELFGGSTSYSACGNWIDGDNKLITEKVTVIQSYCNSDALDKNIELVISYTNSLKNRLHQEAMSLEVNNILYLI